MFIVSQTSLPYSVFEGSESAKKGGGTMIELQNKKQQAAQIFSLFAELYKPPEVDLWTEINRNRLLERVRNEAEDLFGAVNLAKVQEIPETFEQMKSLYSSSLTSVRKDAALPIESIYKQWTSDQTCQMPFARSTGYLLGDSALHIRFILKEFQMEIPNEYSQTPDHLAVLLELLAYFIENSPDEFVLQFINDHFDWLDDFAEKLVSISKHSFYPQVTELLLDHLKAIKTLYKESK